MIFTNERGDDLPRQARNIHESGYRHVIIRGIGKQILFEDDHDNIFFLRILERYSKETDVSVCAYCLMENHAHLLIYDHATNTSLLMKKIGVCYSAYFNDKYERTGHLFQDRYKCENINDDRYYLTALRYILRNPEKAGICATDKYRWSSYHAYGDESSFLEQSFTQELIKDKQEYHNFIMTDNHDSCMEFAGRKDDAWAKDIVEKIIGVSSGTLIQNYGRCERDQALRLLKSEGLSIRQIERLTGINRGVIQKA